MQHSNQDWIYPCTVFRTRLFPLRAALINEAIKSVESRTNEDKSSEKGIEWYF